MFVYFDIFNDEQILHMLIMINNCLYTYKNENVHSIRYTVSLIFKRRIEFV